MQGTPYYTALPVAIAVEAQTPRGEDFFHSHPTENRKKCWLDHLNLPHGRDEKQKNQTNTVPV